MDSLTRHSVENLTTRSVSVRAVLAPMARPLRTAVGAIEVSPLVLIDIATEEGPVGRAYVFAYLPVVLPALHRMVLSMGEELIGKPANPRDIMAYMNRRYRLVGWQGLIGMAVSGIDMALWDAAGRAANLPVARLLGAAPRPLSAYDSFGMIDLKGDAKTLQASIDAGFRAIKIKIGAARREDDVAVVAGVRDIIGPDVRLMVDFNQSLDVPEAIRRIRALESFDLTWAEEPVPAEDLAGHAKVRAAVDTPIQTGENWWFPAGAAAAMAAGACDYSMPDIMKIGGFSGWTDAVAICAGTPVSNHIFVEASAHALAATPNTHWLEYLDLAGALLKEPVSPSDGKVEARGPGLGLDWDEKQVARYLQ